MGRQFVDQNHTINLRDCCTCECPDEPTCEIVDNKDLLFLAIAEVRFGDMKYNHLRNEQEMLIGTSTLDPLQFWSTKKDLNIQNDVASNFSFYSYSSPMALGFMYDGFSLVRANEPYDSISKIQIRGHANYPSPQSVAIEVIPTSLEVVLGGTHKIYALSDCVLNVPVPLQMPDDTTGILEINFPFPVDSFELQGTMRFVYDDYDKPDHSNVAVQMMFYGEKGCLDCPATPANPSTLSADFSVIFGCGEIDKYMFNTSIDLLSETSNCSYYISGYWSDSSSPPHGTIEWDYANCRWQLTLVDDIDTGTIWQGYLSTNPTTPQGTYNVDIANTCSNNQTVETIEVTL